jgi:auxin-responsive protein IAA
MHFITAKFLGVCSSIRSSTRTF